MPSFYAVCYQATPYISIGSLSKKLLLANPAVLPAGAAYGCAFSPDGTKLAVAHGGSPFITVYNTSDWSKIANPAVLPASTANGCAFSPDGTKLAVAHTISPFITVYNTSDWSKIANPAVLPAGAANGCAFSPDGTKLAVAHGGSPFITVYNTSDWSKIANPAVLPASTAYGCAFSPDGTKLAVAHAGSPFITVYNTSDLVLDSALMAQMRSTGGGLAVAFTQAGGLQLRGEVRDIDGYVASRKVRVYERSSGDLVAETTSSAVNGAYDVMVYEGNVAYDVQFMADPLENLNDLFFAKAIAGPP